MLVKAHRGVDIIHHANKLCQGGFSCVVSSANHGYCLLLYRVLERGQMAYTVFFSRRIPQTFRRNSVVSSKLSLDGFLSG